MNSTHWGAETDSRTDASGHLSQMGCVAQAVTFFVHGSDSFKTITPGSAWIDMVTQAHRPQLTKSRCSLNQRQLNTASAATHSWMNASRAKQDLPHASSRMTLQYRSVRARSRRQPRNRQASPCAAAGLTAAAPAAMQNHIAAQVSHLRFSQ